jgi:hypothetical protein
MFTTCEDEKCRVVGNAEPHPNMFTSNFSIVAKIILIFIIGGVGEKYFMVYSSGV